MQTRKGYDSIVASEEKLLADLERATGNINTKVRYFSCVRLRNY
jgi:hypothetical protein